MNALIENKDVLINALLFQTLWFVAILAQGYWPLIPLAAMYVHVYSIRKKQSLCAFSLLMLAVVGIVFDSVYHFIGVYQFGGTIVTLPYFDIPLWLACLWLGFCLTLPVSLSWLVRKPYLFIFACALLGPISYLAGRRLGGLDFSDSNLWMLALEWAVFSTIALVFLFPKLGMSRMLMNSYKKEPAC